MIIPDTLPNGMAETGWRVVPDPHIEESSVYVVNVPRTQDILIVVITEYGCNEVCVLRMPKDLEFTLARGMEGEEVYRTERGLTFGQSLSDAIEYACSFL